MADSIRKQIMDALVTALGSMTIAGGYNYDWSTGAGGGGSEKYRNVNTFTDLPKTVAGYTRETKRDESTRLMQNALDVDILAVVEWNEASDATEFEDDIDAAVYDVELLLLTQAQLDPPLGITGLERIIINGHDKMGPTNTGSLAGAVSVTMQYSHKVTDPGAYT